MSPAELRAHLDKNYIVGISALQSILTQWEADRAESDRLKAGPVICKYHWDYDDENRCVICQWTESDKKLTKALIRAKHAARVYAQEQGIDPGLDDPSGRQPPFDENESLKARILDLESQLKKSLKQVSIFSVVSDKQLERLKAAERLADAELDQGPLIGTDEYEEILEAWRKIREGR